jgi:hypothetical protein
VNLIRRVYEAEPLVCPRCGSEMRVVSFITDPGVVKRIVDHLRKRDRVARPPPPRVHQPVASPAYQDSCSSDISRFQVCSWQP